MFRSIPTIVVLLSCLTALPLAAQEKPTLLASTTPVTKESKGAFTGEKLMYTTYFYTATEAIVHGYADDTKVRVVSLGENRTIWSGTVNRGETKLVPTGKGVFGFLSDKKASLLVGTPSSCTVVGYWLRDDEGTHVAEQFFGRIPTTSSADDRVIVWAWKDINVNIKDVTNGTVLKTKSLKKGERLELSGQALTGLGGHVLDFKADAAGMAVQVYYDQGFFVPGPDGRTAGREFRTYVGKTTEGVNDLNLFSYFTDAKVSVTDIDTKTVLWKGTVKKGGVHTLTLAGKYVEVKASTEISALVAPYEHYKSGYAEHHYGAGVEGTGIETEFLLTSPDELWLFSYFPQNRVEVFDQKTGEKVWSGDLGAGHVQGLTPGHGFYRVKSSAGISVMGGDEACGAEYSPAAGLFAVDEELLKVATEILQERRDKAAKEGRKLSKAEESAPLNDAEADRARRRVRQNVGKSMSPSEVQQRMDSMVTY